MHANGNKIPSPRTSIDADITSDDSDTRLAQQRQRHIANRRDRHNARRQLHVTAQVSIRRLLAGAA